MFASKVSPPAQLQLIIACSHCMIAVGKHDFQNSFRRRRIAGHLLRTGPEAGPLLQGCPENSVHGAGHRYHPRGSHTDGCDLVDARKHQWRMHGESSGRFQLSKRSHGLLLVSHMGSDRARPAVQCRENLLWPLAFLLAGALMPVVTWLAWKYTKKDFFRKINW